jgi:Arc/MetJ-type ribon-helix-helix transcriptional regulator
MANEPPTTSLTPTISVVPEDDFEKITVLLPRDTVQRIDNMARTGLLGSRGRVIQALVDAVSDSAPDIGQAMLQARRMAQIAATPRSGFGPNLQAVQQELASLNAVMFSVGQILTRLNKFLGIRLVETGKSAHR